MDLVPTDIAARTFTGLDLSDLTGAEALYVDDRLGYTDGFTQRVRLYPRQDKDYVFTVRYMQRHKPMQEDGDVSAVPPDHRMLIAYRASQPFVNTAVLLSALSRSVTIFSIMPGVTWSLSRS